MFDFITKSITKLFGSKSERDLKELQPIIEDIHEAHKTIATLSIDELRGRTQEFRKRIADHIKEEQSRVDELKKTVETLPLEEQEAHYAEIDRIEKDITKKIEEVLKDILPEAFAVMKETAKRFKDNPTLIVKATDLDRQLAVSKGYVSIEGDNAIWQNNWIAAGNRVTWDMVHYDVQLIGGAVLHSGKIAEMATGEGKTLVATLPVYLNALPARGVHVVTVNNYLAKRDSEWNGPVFEFLGLTVDCIDKHEPNSDERRRAYLADITYGTNNEFGFDYLRDNMARSPEELVQRKHNYAIVDEVDSVLIDDARTPLIISGPTPRGDRQEFIQYKGKVEKVVEAQKKYITSALVEAKRLIAEGNEKEGGIALLRAHRGLPKNKALIKFLGEPGMKALLQKTENHYMQDQNREMHKIDAELYFVIDEKHNSIELTEKGLQLMTSHTEDPRFFVLPDVGGEIAEIERANLSPQEKAEKKDELLREFGVKAERVHTVNQLLKAYTLFERDVDYVIDENKVKIVDEQTGRIMEGRRWSDGLHQAVEAKENVKVEAATQTYATITLQNYFRMYNKLAGMTGTAETEAGEFWSIYKLDVVVIPTNKPIIRRDMEDLVYKTKREKYNAVIDEIVKCVEAGRPVLVGTTSVEISELLSRMLKLRGIKHNVLNAKLHQKEAEIVAEAGLPGTVTIATNMAGRGTDIKLGPGVKEAGGLAIIGTERHESRRVDRQLRGRAGRQGDPGSSQFFVSLEDDLMRLFGSDRIARMMDRMGLKEGEVIQHSMITRSIERAQKKVEENNFGVRKRLIEYDDVMNAQREVVYTRRRHALFGERLSVDIVNMIYDVAESIVTEFSETKDYQGFNIELMRVLSIEAPVSEQEYSRMDNGTLTQKVYEAAEAAYIKKSEAIAQKSWNVIKQVYEEQGHQFENIVTPFTDGNRGIQVMANLKKAYESRGKELVTSFEKAVVLAMIDDSWKEHLREMDDLKQNVQNAVYEQKDPLLVYKLESFKVFQGMVGEMNKNIISFLVKGNLPDAQQESPVQQVRQAPKVAQPKLVESKAEATPTTNATVHNQPEMPPQPQMPQQPKVQQVVRTEQKIGRNDPCPCGSGKKYKQCHGK